MGVQFRLGQNDHKTVEDFLGRRPSGVSAIVLDPKNPHQQAVAEVAAGIGLGVFLDLATERLTGHGFQLPGKAYDALYDVDWLASRRGPRQHLVAAVLAGHPDQVTAVTPPHFLVHDPRSADLNIALAAGAGDETDKPVRPILLISTQWLVTDAIGLAEQYAQLGVTQIELRVTPWAVRTRA